ncbi:MAG TPA: ACP S-malonyltransferase [Chloroflexota bacterium]|nr:ACP S-malonyltransferase [Chloroflexota bacterium]
MKRLGLIFPGQGAQHPGMGQALWERFSSVRDVFARASDLLHRDLSQQCFEGTDDVLRETDVTQPALYVVGYAGWCALRELAGDGLTPVVGAGHSLGEYTALAAAGALTFADGLQLVAERGRLMHRAATIPGTMLAILGLSVEQVEAACVTATRQSETGGVVVIANDNAPGQVVISGTPDAVALAGTAARDVGARRLIPLATSGAFHSPLLEPVAKDFKRVIDATPLSRAAWPIIANSTARKMQQPDDIRDELSAQLCARVRWVESVRQIAADQVGTLIELGPGQVLSGLVRRIAPAIEVLSIGDGEGLDAAVAAL